MAYEEQVEVRSGEAVILYGQSSVETGTLTIQAGPTFSLYSSDGVVVPTLNGVAATGFDAPAALVRVWYRLDTTGLATGVYNAVFTYEAVASADSLNRRDKPDIQVHILGPVEVPATYNLSNTIGKCRLISADKDLTDPVLSDTEWQFFIDRAGVNSDNEPRLYLAVAYFFEYLANQHAPLSTLEKVAIFETDEKKSQDALVERIKAMYRLDASSGGVDPLVGPTTIRFELFPPSDGTTRPMQDW